jgi:hypothetical protein
MLSCVRVLTNFSALCFATEACISTACNEHVCMLGDTGTKHNHSPDTCTLTSTDPQTVFLRVLMIFYMFCFAIVI